MMGTFSIKYVKCFLLVLFATAALKAVHADPPEFELICGKWMSEEKNLMVRVYHVGPEFRAKIVWFKGEPGHPMEEWVDNKNPNPALRSRKVLGLEILHDLKYDAERDSWEDGIVYDSKHGHEWNAAAHIDKQGFLHVRGYWHFKIIGRTMIFHRVN